MLISVEPVLCSKEERRANRNSVVILNSVLGGGSDSIDVKTAREFCSHFDITLVVALPFFRFQIAPVAPPSLASPPPSPVCTVAVQQAPSAI